MRLQLLSLLAALAPYTLADVKFTSPAAGASIPAGPITVTWTESGTAPSISQLQSYTISLMVGGNTDSNAMPLITIGTGAASFARGNTATGTISPAIAAQLTNGFYLKMISTAKEGGTVTNYSGRFTITGMTGSTPPQYSRAVTALGGSTAGPPTVNGVVAAAPVPAADPAAVPAAGAYDVPYAQQEGLTRYAPMQGVPPTKITKKQMTPLFPTSAYVIAKTWLPRPSIVTTLTNPQTFSVASHANTAAPQSQPTGDMAKFLARWKD